MAAVVPPDIRERRRQCGLTQAELAGRAGVSRQLVAAVEAGRHSPAVDSALALAAALGSTVEELFGTAPPTVLPALAGELRGDVPLRVGRVGGSLVAAELPDHGVAGAGWAKPDAVAQDGEVRLFPGARPAGLVLAGCDPAFGLAERLLEGLGERSMLAISAPTALALESLSMGRLHAAIVHGMEHELPAPPVPVRRWHVARWQVGMAVAPGVRASSLEGVLGAEVPLVQRERAAMIQRAFERACAAIGIPRPARVTLHAGGHLEAARLAAVLGGAGLSTEGAAHAFGLRFLAIEEHVVQLWVAERWLEHPGVDALGQLLSSAVFTERVAQFGGYDLAGCGLAVTG